MKVSIIGSGNVASHIAKALHHQKVVVQSIWSRHFENAKDLAHKVDAKAVAIIPEIINDGSDLVIISVKDDVIAELAQQLVGYKGIVAHTSGAVDLNVLNNNEQFGVFYPLQTFSKQTELNFAEVPVCIEASNEEGSTILNQLATKITKNVYTVNSEKRKTLHLAAVFACNFPNYLYGVAQQLLAKDGLDFEIIRPLIKETAHKVQHAFPANVQTGPAARNDTHTLGKHEGLLQDNPNWLAIYKLLSEQIKKSK